MHLRGLTRVQALTLRTGGSFRGDLYTGPQGVLVFPLHGWRRVQRCNATVLMCNDAQKAKGLTDEGDGFDKRRSEVDPGQEG